MFDDGASVQRDPAEDVPGESLLSVLILQGLAPGAGREFQDATLGPTRQQAEEVAQVLPGIELVQLATGQQRHEGGVHLATLVAADVSIRPSAPG